MERISPETRSKLMARVRRKDTMPELIVRRLLHSMGYRFRLHRKDLPGKPDIVLPRHRAVVFCHGCFWHAHTACARGTPPATNTDWWVKKLERNVSRDRRNRNDLETSGWKVLVVWQCQLQDEAALRSILERFLSGDKTKAT